MERGVPYRGIGFRVEHGIPGRGIVLRTEDRRKEMGWIIQGALYGRTCNIDPAFSLLWRVALTMQMKAFGSANDEDQNRKPNL